MKSFTFIRNKRGYTLVELMVAVGIATFIAATMFAVARVGQEQTHQAELKMTIQDSAREGMYKMLQEIRQTAPDQVTISNGGNTIAFNIPDKDNPTAENYRVDWSGATQIQYSVGGTGGQQLIRTNLGTGETTVMANSVASLNFELGSGNNVVTVTMGVQKTTANGRLVPATPLLLNGEAELRNAEDEDEGGSDDDSDADDDDSNENVDGGSDDDSDDNYGSGDDDDADDDDSNENVDNGSDDDSGDNDDADDDDSNENVNNGSDDDSDDDDDDADDDDDSDDHGSGDDDDDAGDDDDDDSDDHGSGDDDDDAGDDDDDAGDDDDDDDSDH